MKIKAVVFDAYGTLFDVYSIQVLADELFPGKGADIAAKWRDKQIEYTRLITQSDPHNVAGSQYFRPFWELTRLSLEYTLDRLKLNRQSGQVEQLMAQYARLTPFPENLAVLKKIKAQGLVTAILSNGSMDMLTSAVKSAGMEGVLDHVISVDLIRLFKTSPETYGLIQKTIPVGKGEVLFVSSNAWDVLGATWFGLTTHWVNRQGLPFEALTPRPDFSGSDLNSVLLSLEHLSGGQPENFKSDKAHF
jgi:2-haloacid dehalogenase